MLTRIAFPTTVLATLVLAVSAEGQIIQRGSDLQRAPISAAQGNECAAQWYPSIDANGGPYQPYNSNQPTCSYYQGFVFGNSNDPRTGFVPSDGVINTVTVRSGAHPAPLSFLILRQLTPAALGAPAGSAECCFFVRETPPVQPSPNTTTTFTVNLPVENNRALSVITQDALGISAAAGSGELPLAVIPEQFNYVAFTSPGTLTSGAFFPRLGALANDSGGGRRETNTYAGFELLVHYSFTPGSGTVSPGGGVSLGPTDITTIGGGVLRPIGGALDVILNCLQVSCSGSVKLLSGSPVLAARAGGKAKIRALGSSRFKLRRGKGRKVHVTLNALGRKLSHHSTKVKVVVDLGKVGTTSRNLTMKPAHR